MAVDKYFQRYYNEYIYPSYTSGNNMKLWNYLNTSTYSPGGANYYYVSKNGSVKEDHRDIYDVDGSRSNMDYLYYDKLAYEQMKSGNLDPSLIQNIIANTAYGKAHWNGNGTDYYSVVNPWINEDIKLAEEQQAKEQAKYEAEQKRIAEEAEKARLEAERIKTETAEKNRYFNRSRSVNAAIDVKKKQTEDLAATEAAQNAAQKKNQLLARSPIPIQLLTKDKKNTSLLGG